MKTVIVGASVSGLACAERILESKLESEVVLVEQKSKVGQKICCGGGVSKWMIEKVGVFIPPEAVLTNIRRVRIYAPNMNYWELKGSRDYGYVLSREILEEKIAERVQSLGGTIMLKRRVTFKDLESWHHEVDYIVGGDGPTSVVRKWVGLLKYSFEDLHLGVQKTIVMDYYPDDTIELYFGEKVAPHGYAWIFSCGEGLVRIGLGIPLSERANAGKLLENFIDRQICDHKKINYRAKLIPTAKMPKTGIYGNVLLIGDALPSTDPATGGGIIQAIASGKAAGKAIVEEKIKNYNRYLRWLRKQNNIRYRLKNVLYSFRDDNFNDLIDTLKGFKPKSLSVGKELRRAVGYLLVRKPRLLRKFLKAFS